MTFIDKEGSEHTFEVSAGDNLMDIAQAEDLEMEGPPSLPLNSPPPIVFVLSHLCHQCWLIILPSEQVPAAVPAPARPATS